MTAAIIDARGSQYVVVGAGAALAGVLARQAQESAAAAGLAEAHAESLSGPTYPDTATGLAATASGDFFAVDNGDGTVSIYLDNAGVAVLQRRLATTAALAASGGGNLVGIQHDGAGAVLEDVDAVLRRLPKKPQSYGQYSVLSTKAQNKAAIQAMINATPSGGVCEIPDPGGVQIIDCSAGVSGAITVAQDRITIVNHARLKMDEGVRRANPSCMFVFSGEGINLVGPGQFIGSGAFDQVNIDEEDTFPVILLVTGDNFEMDGPRLVDPPKIGLFLKDCTDSKIWKSPIIGGPTSRTDTSHFGIRTSGGSGHKIYRALSELNASGGKCVQAIFANSPSITVDGLTGTAWEKAFYGIGNNQKVENIDFENALLTDTIRIQGSDCLVRGFVGRDLFGGVTVYNGPRNTVEGVHVTGIKQTAVYYGVLPGSSYTGGFSNTHVSDVMAKADGLSADRADGVFLNLEGADSVDVIVDKIDLEGFCQGAAFSVDNPVTAAQGQLRIEASVIHTVIKPYVTRVTTRNTTRKGMVMRRCVGGTFDGGMHINCGEEFAADNDGSENSWTDHNALGVGARGILNLNPNSTLRGNKYGAKALSGTFTLATGGATSTTVTHGEIEASRAPYIKTWPISGAASTWVAANGPALITVESDGDFVVTFVTGNPQSTAGMTFGWELITQ